MRYFLLILSLLLVSIQSLSAQDNDIEIIDLRIENNVDENIFPNFVSNVLKIKNNTTIDFIRLYNKQGDLVVQLIPVNNQVNLNAVQPGFYMAHAYKGGKEVDKSILKKI